MAPTRRTASPRSGTAGVSLWLSEDPGLVLFDNLYAEKIADGFMLLVK